MPGQSVSEIRQKLRAAGLTPRHRFGQNFLIDLNLMRKLPTAADLEASDIVLEVGCGTGSLTECLLAHDGVRVIGVEIDRGLQGLLRDGFAGETRFTLIPADVLAGKHALAPEVVAALAAAREAQPGAVKLVANLPYQVATPLLIELLLVTPPLARMVCTIQREVGDRLVALPGTRDYGTISVVAQSLARVERVAVLPPKAFWPAPKVESVVMRLVPLAAEGQPIPDPRAFARFVQLTFTQRRKTLRSALRTAGVRDPDALCERAELAAKLRPEQVTPAQWQALYRNC